MNVLISIVAFLISATVLIVFHEYGHFIIGRLLGAHVERFSVGLGRVLLSRTDKHGTEYTLCAVPFGGYVKFIDATDPDTPKELLPKAFQQLSFVRRTLIIIAGSAFNLILAVLLFTITFTLGIQTIAPIVQAPEPQSIAAEAGLQANDEILQIGEHETKNWRDVHIALLEQMGRKAIVPLRVEAKSGNARDLQLDLRQWQIGGLRPAFLDSLGIRPYVPPLKPIIAHVVKDSAADNSGIKVGDTIVAVDNKPIKDWNTFVKYIKVSPLRTISVTIERNGQRKQLTLTPAARKSTRGRTEGYAGVAPRQTLVWPDHMIRTLQYPAWYAVWPAIKETQAIVSLTLTILGKLITGSLSLQTLSGPIGIALSAGQTASGGLAVFLNFLGLLSVTLGIINMLPIPVLDGGQLVMLIIETIRGKPFSDRVQFGIFKAGVFILLALMSVAVVNDLARLWQ